MDIRVMSRSNFEKYKSQSHSNSCLVISISSLSEPIVDIDAFEIQNARIFNILHIKANDIDKLEQGALTREGALRIAEFVDFYTKTQPDIPFIVHCGAGQSRSAGVTAAILKYYTNDDRAIFNNRRYTPNMFFYRSVLEALHYINQ